METRFYFVSIFWGSDQSEEFFIYTLMRIFMYFIMLKFIVNPSFS